MRFLIIGLLLLATPARAADDPVLRVVAAHYEQGTKLYNLGDFRNALDEFKAAYLARRAAEFLFNIAQCYRQLGEHESAAREYRAYLREKPDAKNRADVEAFIAAADREIARREAARPPTGVIGTPEVEPARRLVVVEAAPVPEATPPVSRKVWLPVVLVAVGAVVLAGVAVGLAYGLPNDAAAHAGTDPSAGIRF